ncbi:unnamed protein product, partial [marine sediment metagenome]
GLREQNTQFSQAEAARLVGLKPAQLNYLEQGNRAPNETLPLIQLAQLYHVAPDEILRRAYWPQLILLPLVSILDLEELSNDLIEEIENGFERAERQELTHHIEELLRRRTKVK